MAFKEEVKNAKKVTFAGLLKMWFLTLQEALLPEQWNRGFHMPRKRSFLGAPGVCTPYAELFDYAIIDKKSVFIPLADIKSAKKIDR